MWSEAQEREGAGPFQAWLYRQAECNGHLRRQMSEGRRGGEVLQERERELCVHHREMDKSVNIGFSQFVISKKYLIQFSAFPHLFSFPFLKKENLENSPAFQFGFLLIYTILKEIQLISRQHSLMQCIFVAHLHQYMHLRLHLTLVYVLLYT